MPFNHKVAAASATFAALTGGALLYHNASVHAEVASDPAASIKIQRPAGSAAENSPAATLMARTGAAFHSGTEYLSGLTGGGSQVQVIKEQVVVPFHTQYTRTFRLMPGRQWVNSGGGINGLRQDTVRVTRLNGKVVGHTILSSHWERQPADRLIAVGVSPFETSRSFNGLSRPFTMRASKYDMYLRDKGAGGPGNGITCTGVRARRGIVAVDPRVIPFGTHLYVEGYGYCVAADRGGAIKGDRIDLCVENPREADAYGIRPVKVCIAR